MTHQGRCRWSAILSALVVLTAFTVSESRAQAPAFPNPIPDDNGDYAFAREVVPILLGRRPRGALEVKLLGDIAKLEGRDVMVQMLTRRKEFYTHWSKILLDNLQVQRSGQRQHASTCFNMPRRMASATIPVFDSGALAQYIRNEPPTTTATPPLGGQDFNMADVMLSALQEDDLSVVMRAYLFTLGMSPGRPTSEERSRTSLGTAFTHIYLSRNIGCLTCHNETFSVTGPASGWDRLFALPINISEALFGSAFGGDVFSTYNLFRTDQRSSNATSRILPWKIDPSCVTDSFSSSFVGYRLPTANNSAQVDFANIAGNDKGLMDIDQSLQDGIELYSQSGMLLQTPVGDNPPVPSDERVAFAYQVALTAVDHIWQNVTGEKLSIALYFPRNAAQRDALWNLTENVFLANDWSLSSLLTAILTSRYTNRRAPDHTLNTSDYVLPMIIDPWVAKDPRLPDSAFDDPNDPKLSHNGQGEVVHRHHPTTLLHAVAKALGWQEPKPYGNAPYPSAALMRDIGQYWSENETGSKGIDFQTLLAWESTHGACQRPNGVSQDWIDRLVEAVSVYNAEHPFRPLLLEDLVQTMKDWLIQQAEISETAAQESGLSEIAALSAIFSAGTNLTVPLTSPTTLFPDNDLRTKLRQVCGVLLETPHFMLAGISPAEPLVIPRLRVCNDPNDCSYKDMCEAYRTTLATAGRYIQCLDNDVVPGTGGGGGGPRSPCRMIVRGAGLPQIPRIVNICDIVPDPRLECLRDLVTGAPGPITLDNLCRPEIPRCDPRCAIGDIAFNQEFGGGLLGGGELGLLCCGGGGGRPFDLTEPESLLAWMEGARVLTAEDVLILKRGERTVRPLKPDTQLSFGDVLVLPPGARFEARGEVGIIGFEGGRIASKFERTTRPLDRSLLEAIERSDEAAAYALLKERANPMAIDAKGRSAMVIAAERGNVGIIRALFDKGADIGKPDLRGMTALRAAQLAKQDRAAKLIERLGGSLGREKVRAAEAPTLLMVTGPSAKTAPPVQGDKFLSTAQARELKAAGKFTVDPPSLDLRLSLLRKHGYFGPSITGEDMIRINEFLWKLGPQKGIH